MNASRNAPGILAIGAFAAAAVVVAVSACDAVPVPAFDPGPGPNTAVLTATTDPAPSYDRDQFGPGWTDPDGNRCDTREDVLARDATTATFGPDGCIDQVTIRDPYTGEIVTGRANIDIDHRVPLAWAWRHGAHTWTPERRERFANDPANLIATADNINAGKGDSAPSEWLPPLQDARCDYGRQWTMVTTDYGLPLPPADDRVLADLSTLCGD